MRSSRASDSAERDTWVDDARMRDILAAAQRMGAELKRAGAEHVGGCPACGGTDRFSVNPRKRVFNCRGGDGGDVIRMVMHVKGLDFLQACEWLNDSPPPGSVRSERVEEAKAELPKVAAISDEQRLEEENRYRAKQVEIARGIWGRGVPLPGTPAEAYLNARGIGALPPGLPLEFAAAQPYWHGDGDDAKVLYTGPAMLAAVTDDEGVMVGCHVTWLGENGEKATIRDPGSGKALPAKKLRGSKRRAAIRLITPRERIRLVVGEGIETTLSAFEAERTTMRAAFTAYWAAIDLGHLGGKAAETVKHPTKFHDSGRPLMVPGPEPELHPERDLMPTDDVTEIVLLGDGDSDHFTTELALIRAVRRWDRPGREIRIAWAPDGQDFNDALRGDAPA